MTKPNQKQSIWDVGFVGGTRRLLSSYRGPLMHVVRMRDGEGCDIYADESDELFRFDYKTLQDFVGDGEYSTTFYDQAASDDTEQKAEDDQADTV